MERFFSQHKETVSVLSILIAILTLAYTITVAYLDRQRAALDTVKSAREISKHVVDLVPMLAPRGHKDVDIARRAMTICLKRLADFPIDKIQPPTLTFNIVSVQIVGDKALAYSLGELGEYDVEGNKRQIEDQLFRLDAYIATGR